MTQLGGTTMATHRGTAMIARTSRLTQYDQATKQTHTTRKSSEDGENGKEQSYRIKPCEDDEGRKADHRAGGESIRSIGKSFVCYGGDELPRSEIMMCPICNEEHELHHCIPLGVECCEFCADEYCEAEGFKNVNLYSRG
jgi:hypothetical protein